MSSRQMEMKARVESAASSPPEFARVTEQWGMRMPPGQIAMAYRRYRFAAEQAGERDYLEIGCGSGFGLQHVADIARLAVGGDLSLENLRSARHHAGSLPFLQFDAHRLPFRSNAFDVVSMFEVIYYLDAERALAECRRVLRANGTLLLCLPNCDAPGFHESPHSTSYYSVPNIARLLDIAGFDCKVFGAFAASSGTSLERAVLAAAKIAERLHIVPHTLAGRSFIKRIVYRNVAAFQGLHNVSEGPEPLVQLDPEKENLEFRNLYVLSMVRLGT